MRFSKIDFLRHEPILSLLYLYVNINSNINAFVSSINIRRLLQYANTHHFHVSGKITVMKIYVTKYC